jgi:hypothetical protein
MFWGMIMFDSTIAKRRAFWLAYSALLLTLSWALVMYVYAN